MNDYTVLKDLVNKYIPEEFRSDFFIRKEYPISCPSTFYNYNPYKWNGELLPDEIRLIEKTTRNTYHLTHNGNKWFLETLLRIYANNLYECLPAAFIYVFLKEYGNEVISRTDFKEELYDYMDKAKEDLKGGKLPMPHPSTSYFLNASERFDDYMYDLLHSDATRLKNIISDPKRLAILICEVTSSITERFNYEYWTFSEYDYKRAKRVFIEAREAFFAEVFK